MNPGSFLPPTDPREAPRKRFRGKRRWFRDLEHRAAAFRLEVEPDSWWDRWHYHGDDKGWTNRSERYRLQNLAGLALVYSHLAERAPAVLPAFQAWILLDAEDAGQDATYLHTENPNPGSAFPLRLSTERWESVGEGSPWRALLPGLELRQGFFADGSRVLYAPGVGIPLEES